MKCQPPDSPVFPPFINSSALLRGKFWVSRHNSHTLPPCLIEAGRVGDERETQVIGCCCHALLTHTSYPKLLLGLHQPSLTGLKRLLPLPSLAPTKSRAGAGMTPLIPRRLPVKSGTPGLLSSQVWETFHISPHPPSSPYRRRGPHPPATTPCATLPST